MYEVLAWLELNRKRVITWGVVAFVLVAASYVYVWMRGQTMLQANEALLALRPGDSARATGTPATPDQFLKVANQYASTEVAARARLLAAGELYAAGKYAEALGEFQKAEQADSSDLLKPIAALGVAACLDAQDKSDEALAAYQSVISKYPDQPAATQARLAIALIHEARNQPAQALKVYDDVVGSRTPGRASMEAAAKREALLKLHPELAPTNVPVAAPDISAKVVATPATNSVPAK